MLKNIIFAECSRATCSRGQTEVVPCRVPLLHLSFVAVKVAA